ncbi:MAG: hypothetical protein H2184_14125 [Candidatus Galacturonibacter soehngenii]|nr:hypothetical protein [Candidatus Galacturonibacter soehngenii]
MDKKLKALLICSMSLYMISFVFGIINAEVSFKDLFTNPNLEKIIFIIYNLYIITCFIFLIGNKIQALYMQKRLFWITAVGYIILQILYLAIRIYKTFEMYSMNFNDARKAIGAYLINPNGFVFNVTTTLILLQVFFMLTNNKKQ